MLKKIYTELVSIRRELQTIRMLQENRVMDLEVFIMSRTDPELSEAFEEFLLSRRKRFE